MHCFSWAPKKKKNIKPTRRRVGNVSAARPPNEVPVAYERYEAKATQKRRRYLVARGGSAAFHGAVPSTVCSRGRWRIGEVVGKLEKAAADAIRKRPGGSFLINFGARRDV